MKLHEAFTPEESEKIYSNFLAIVNDPKRRDRLVRLHGANTENVAYGTAVNQVKKKAEKGEEISTEETPIEEPMDKETKLKEMIQAALSKPLNEKKKSFPDLTGDGKVTKADILKARGVDLEEGNLYPNETYSIEPEGRFWIVTWRTADGKKEKVFQSEDEARKFASTLNEDLDLGHQDDEPHMLKSDLYNIGKYAMELYKIMDNLEGPQEVDLPHWWQSKVIQAKDLLDSAKHYLEFELKEPQIDAVVDIASQENTLNSDPIKELAEGVFDRIKAKIKGGTTNVGTRFKNLGAAWSGRKDDIKDPVFQSGLSKIKVKTKNLTDDVDDMLYDLDKLFPEEKLEKTPELEELINNYKDILNTLKAAGNRIAKGEVVSIKRTK